MAKIIVQNTEITVLSHNDKDYISLTDMANFKVVEFDHFRMQAGLPNFTLSASEWIERTNAIGIIVKQGRSVDRA